MTQPASLTLAGLLSRGPSARTAVLVPDGPRATYGQLAERVEALAGTLAAVGVASGSVVSLVLGNDLAFLAAFLAVARAGAVAAPLNPSYTAEECRFSMEDAGARMVILPPGPSPAREAAASLRVPCLDAASEVTGRVALSRDGRALAQGTPPPAPASDAVALFLHTSGTTSRPKGVPLTHGNLMASIATIGATYRLTPEDTALAVMPLFHVHGLLGVALSTLWTGGALVLPQRFSASAFWPVVAQHRVTWYSAVPTIHQVLLARAEQDRAPKGAFRFIRSCSAALAPTVLEQMEARFGSPVLEAYGMTEASHQMASNPLPPAQRRPGTVGLATGVSIAVLDERGAALPPGTPGEVCIQGPNVMKGYKDNPQANAAGFTNGWFRTGDQGSLSADGYLRLSGRLKELINRGGEKIAPLEVDAVLAQHPAVAEAICFGVADAKYGEEVHAAVVLRAQATPQEIQRFCAQRLADFKVPKAIHFVEQLPRTATGKVQRRHVAAQFAGKS